MVQKAPAGQSALGMIEPRGLVASLEAADAGAAAANKVGEEMAVHVIARPLD